MADLAFYHELDCLVNHIHGLDTGFDSDGDDDKQSSCSILPDIFAQDNQPAPRQHISHRCPSSIDNICEDVDYLGPWADSNMPQTNEDQPPEPQSDCDIEEEQPTTEWSTLSRDAQHYLIKVATDYHLREHNSTELPPIELRKNVFRQAMGSLAVEADEIKALSSRYQVRRKKTPPTKPYYNPRRDESTLSGINDHSLADIVKEAQDYVVKTGCDFLLVAIAQTAPLIHTNIHNTPYFGFPDLPDKWQPHPGSIADQQSIAAFRIATSQKGKCSERLLLHYIDLPPRSFVYSNAGVFQLTEHGRYTFHYPEAYSRMLASWEGSEILLCNALCPQNSLQETGPVSAPENRVRLPLIPGLENKPYVKPLDTTIHSSFLVDSVFHTTWGHARKAPIGPQKYAILQDMEQVGRDFKGFSGFLQFFLPKGILVAGPSGKNISLDIGMAVNDSNACPGEGGWYTIITKDVLRGSCNAQRQLLFKDDFIIRMKSSQPVAILRDLELMPRLSEPGLHQFSLVNGREVDLQCANGRYYLWHDMEVPEHPSSTDGVPDENENKNDQQADLSQAESSQKLTNVPGSTFEDQEQCYCSSTETSQSTVGSVFDLKASRSPISSRDSRTISLNTSLDELLKEDDETRQLRHRLIIEQARQTLAPYKAWLASEERREAREDQRYVANLRKQLKQEAAASEAQCLRQQVSKSHVRKSEVATIKPAKRVKKSEVVHKPTQSNPRQKSGRGTEQKSNPAKLTVPGKRQHIKLEDEGLDGSVKKKRKKQNGANPKSLMEDKMPARDGRPKQKKVTFKPRTDRDYKNSSLGLDQSDRNDQVPSSSEKQVGLQVNTQQIHTQQPSPAFYDPATGRTLITMHMRPEDAAQLLAGARFQSSSGSLVANPMHSAVPPQGDLKVKPEGNLLPPMHASSHNTQAFIATNGLQTTKSPADATKAFVPLQTDVLAQLLAAGALTGNLASPATQQMMTAGSLSTMSAGPQLPTPISPSFWPMETTGTGNGLPEPDQFPCAPSVGDAETLDLLWQSYLPGFI